MPFINGQWVDEEELMALQASMIPTVGGYDRGPDAGWGLTNMGGIYGTEPVVGGEGVTPGYNPGLDASIINESMQSQAPVNTIQVPFSQASQTSSITPFASPRYTSYDKGPGWDTSAISLQSAFNPTPQEDVSYWQAPKTEAPVPQVPQRQEVAPQVQAPAPFVAPTYVAPAAPAPVDVEAIRSTVTAPAPFDFSDVSRGRLAEARKYAGQGMFGRAKQQIERGGGEWSKAMHRALRGETGMSAAELARAKDAAVQQATRARQAQHAANVSAAQKRHAAKAKGAAAKAAARQAVIDAQRAAAAAAQQSVIDAQMAAEAAARQKQQDAATAAQASMAQSSADVTADVTGREGDTGSDEYNPYGGTGTGGGMVDPTWPGTGGYGTTTTVSLPEILSYAAPLPGLALLSKIPAVGKALTAAEKAMRRNLLKGAGGVAALGAAGQLGKEAVERAIEFGKTGGVETFKDIGFKTVDVLDEFGKTIGFRNVISKGPKKGQKLDPHLKDNIQVRSKKGTDKTPYDWAGAPIGASVAEIVSNAASAPAGALERKAADDARAAAQAEKDRQAQIAAAAASAITSKRAIAKAKAAANKEKKAAARRAAAAQRALDSARAAAARAAAASAAQAKAAQKAAKAVLARLGQDRNMPSAREVAKAREVLSQIDTFGTGGQRGFMGAEIGIEDGGGYTGGDFSSGEGWE